jgi:hypothetical protein
MVVGRDAQRIRYQSIESPPPETITHLEDIGVQTFRALGDLSALLQRKKEVQM